jgi:hypothetical protein
MLPKRRKPNPPKKVESPLDAKMREIAEREAKTRAQMEECQKVIKEAPQRAEKIAQARREEIRTRVTRTETRRRNPAALTDKWRTLEVNAAAPAQYKRLRKERRQGRQLFFVLLLVLLGVCYWLYYTVTHS